MDAVTNPICVTAYEPALFNPTRTYTAEVMCL